MRSSLAAFALVLAMTSCGRSEPEFFAIHDAGPIDTYEPSPDTAIEVAADTAVCAWGGFAPAVTYGVCPSGDIQPTPIAVGDFNGDGHLDLASLDFGNYAVAILINNGDGTFASYVSYAAGSAPRQLVAADFDGDGRLDLAIADCLGSASNYQSTIAVLKGHGDGTFAAPVLAPTGGQCAEALMVGDLNGDKHPDVATTNHNSNSLAILLNHGDGTFAAGVTYEAANPDSLALADLDGNGTLDVIVSLRTAQSASFETFFNDGKGALTAGATYAFGPTQSPALESAGYLVTGDFHRIGRNDLIVSDTVNNELLLYSNPGNGVFGTPTTIPLDGLAGPLYAADFNRDGLLDIATSLLARPADGGSVAISFALMLGAASDTFSPPVTFGSPQAPNYVAAADFNGDGYPDMVVGDMSWVNVLLSQCAGDAGP